jgi:hypothetical protein
MADATPKLPPDRKPDAVLVPKPFRGLADPLHALTDLFRPLVNGRRLYLFTRPGQFAGLPQVRGSYYLATSPDHTLHFPKLHPLESAPRYDWYSVAPDDRAPLGLPVPVGHCDAAPAAVRFGWLVDEATVTPPGVLARAAHEATYAEQYQALMSRARRYQQLLEARAREPLTRSEQEELDAIEASFQ